MWNALWAALLLLLSGVAAAADEDEHWVLYHCSPSGGTFAFLPVPLKAKELPQVDLKRYSPRRRLQTSTPNHDLKCPLAGFAVRAVIEAFPPSSGPGFCAGVNSYRLGSLSVNGIRVAGPELINHECFASIAFLELRIRERNLHVEICRSLAKRSPPVSDEDEMKSGEIRCESRVIAGEQR